MWHFQHRVHHIWMSHSLPCIIYILSRHAVYVLGWCTYCRAWDRQAACVEWRAEWRTEPAEWTTRRWAQTTIDTPDWRKYNTLQSRTSLTHSDVDAEDVLAQAMCLYASFSSKWYKIHYKLNNIYSWNLTATSGSFYLSFYLILSLTLQPKALGQVTHRENNLWICTICRQKDYVSRT